uniref:Uncharacterized protein n=1 Tax=Ralstonia syzygii R24 TaxID=907261 RepID=G3A1K4_9RALS|nr:hypothetical protein RALSY_11099 [Ralstonia syzygii R24]
MRATQSFSTIIKYRTKLGGGRFRDEREMQAIGEPGFAKNHLALLLGIGQTSLDRRPCEDYLACAQLYADVDPRVRAMMSWAGVDAWECHQKMPTPCSST